MSSVRKEEVRAAAAEEDEKSGEAAGRETLRDEIDPFGRLARAARRLVAVVVAVVVLVVASPSSSSSLFVVSRSDGALLAHAFSTHVRSGVKEIRGETRSGVCVPWRPTVFFCGKSDDRRGEAGGKE